MKYLLKIALGLIVGMGLFITSCDDDDDTVTGFTLDKEDILVGPAGDSQKIVISSGSEWAATSSAPWVMISPANGVGSAECEIRVDSTLENGKREAMIRFTAKGQPDKTVNVCQTGFDKMVFFDKSEFEIEASEAADKRYFEVKVSRNVESKIEVVYENENGEVVKGISWITVPDLKDFNSNLDTARPRISKLRFKWSMNPDPEKRIARIKFVPKNADDELAEPAVITVTQKAAPKIEDNRAGDSLAVIAIRERLRCYGEVDTSESMMNWADVTLWEATDEELPCEEAIGRIRSASFVLFNIKETLPQEVHYLKYVEKLYFYSNTNTSLLSIDLGSDICELEYLKDLTISAYGLVSLPADFSKLGKSLEKLDLGSNNFATFPSVLTKENFPHLKSLQLTAMRRWDTVSDLRKKDDPKYENGIGMHLNLDDDNTIKNLFLWDTLEELGLSYGYLEGHLPEFEVGKDGVVAYGQSDVDAFGNDTIQWLAENQQPKILPKMKKLAINLNFFVGTLPQWILNHPHLMDWSPETFILNQMEKGINSKGENVGFDNKASEMYEEYYKKFPKFKEKYELEEESKEE